MAFDPNEPRDDHGKWTAGQNGGHAAGPFMSVSNPENVDKADKVARKAADVAKDLDFEPHLINVSDESREFELNGQKLNYAGAAHLPPAPEKHTDTDVKGTITLYTPHLTDESIAGVTAHEVMHQKFQAFFNDYRREWYKLQEDPDYSKEDKWVPDETGTSMVSRDGKPVRRELGFMRPDGLLNEPYAARYPAYQSFTETMMPGVDKFAKSDGVTGYSREYWKAYAAQTRSSHLAYHETLAEIARLKYEKQPVENYVTKKATYQGEKIELTSRKKLHADWNRLYKAVEANWKRRNKR